MEMEVADAAPEVQHLQDDDTERDNFSLFDSAAPLAQPSTRSPLDGGGTSLDDSTQGSLTGRTHGTHGPSAAGSFAGIGAERRAIAATRRVIKDAMRQHPPPDPFRQVNRGLSAIVAKHRAMLGILTPVSSHSSLVTMAFSEDLPGHAGDVPPPHRVFPPQLLSHTHNFVQAGTGCTPSPPSRATRPWTLKMKRPRERWVTCVSTCVTSVTRAVPSLPHPTPYILATQVNRIIKAMRRDIASSSSVVFTEGGSCETFQPSASVPPPPRTDATTPFTPFTPPHVMLEPPEPRSITDADAEEAMKFDDDLVRAWGPLHTCTHIPSPPVSLSLPAPCVTRFPVARGRRALVVAGLGLGDQKDPLSGLRRGQDRYMCVDHTSPPTPFPPRIAPASPTPLPHPCTAISARPRHCARPAGADGEP